MVALISSTGVAAGQTRYSAYGVPFGMPVGDVDSDGDVDGTDASIAGGLVFSMGYHVLADVDLDGDVDATDSSAITAASGNKLGRGALSYAPASSTDVGAGNRIGYAGYQHDGAIASIAHVRSRPLHLALGRWISRDPLEYFDSMSLYGYVRSMPLRLIDPMGMVSCDSKFGPPNYFACCYEACRKNGGTHTQCQAQCRHRDPNLPGGPGGIGIPSGDPDGESSNDDPIVPNGPAYRVTMRCYNLNPGYRHCYISWQNEIFDDHDDAQTFSMGPRQGDPPLDGHTWTGYGSFLLDERYGGLRPEGQYQVPVPGGSTRRDFEPDYRITQYVDVDEIPGDSVLINRLTENARRNQFIDNSFNPANCGANWVAARMWSVATGLDRPPMPASAGGWDTCQGANGQNPEFVFIPY